MPHHRPALIAGQLHGLAFDIGDDAPAAVSSRDFVGHNRQHSIEGLCVHPLQDTGQVPFSVGAALERASQALPRDISASPCDN
jgi:hypothetical protein